MDEWIEFSEDNHPDKGSTILVLFKDCTDGITMDDGRTCDISWYRSGDTVITGSGNFKYSDIKAYKLIK